MKEFIHKIGHIDLLGMRSDLPLHFLGGLFAFILFSKMKIPSPWNWILVVFISLLKEFLDFHAVIKSEIWSEPFRDILITLLGAYLGYLILKKSSLTNK